MSSTVSIVSPDILFPFYVRAGPSNIPRKSTAESEFPGFLCRGVTISGFVQKNTSLVFIV
jgi:hypothetical protein